MTDEDLDAIPWVDESGERVSCVEKLKALRETLSELRQVAQDAFEDALVIGCADRQVREILARLIAELQNPYRQTGS